MFFESPSNPMQELIDIEAVSSLAHAAGATVIVDNVFATPVLQRPLELGADISVYSTTKHIDGHGRTLGGIVCGTSEFIYGKLQPLMRHTGPSISPFNAWVLVKSLESLALRVNHQTAATLHIAEHIEQHDRVVAVRYPWLDSHPQAELARKQMSGGGTVVQPSRSMGVGTSHLRCSTHCRSSISPTPSVMPRASSPIPRPYPLQAGAGSPQADGYLRRSDPHLGRARGHR